MTSMKKTDIESLIREASMMIRMWGTASIRGCKCADQSIRKTR